jgi:hypothetical protein
MGNILIEHLSMHGYNNIYKKKDGTFYKKGCGVYLRHVFDALINCVVIASFPEDNVHFEGGWHLYVRDAYCPQAGKSDFHIDSSYSCLEKALSDAGQYGLTILRGGGGTDVRACHFEGAKVAGIRMNGVSGCRIVANVIPDTPVGIIVDGVIEFGSKAIIEGNQIWGHADSALIGIDIKNPTEQVNITGNYIRGFATGIRDTGAGLNVFSGNTIDGVTTGILEQPAPNAAPTAVSGNSIRAKKYAIQHDRGDLVVYTGNALCNSKNARIPIKVLSGHPTIVGGSKASGK